MKHYKKRKKTVEEIDRVTCDMCQVEARSEFDWKPLEKRDLPHFTMETKFKMQELWAWSDGSGETRYTEADLCPKCFMRVVKFIRGEGGEVRVEESDF